MQVKDNRCMKEKPTGSTDPRSCCPINLALELFGDKWTLLLIRDMMFRQLTGYGDFLNSPEGISTNILANRLKQMECTGLIEKLSDPQDGKKYIYLLTERGVDLLPVMVEVVRWGMKYGEQAAMPPEVKEQIESDPEGFIRDIQAVMREKRKVLLAFD